MHVILLGFKSCGKTYFGTLLAQKLQRPFIDTDWLIEELFSPLSCREIYLKIGEERFRTLEKQIIYALHPPMPSIIAVGGGAVLDPANRLALMRLGSCVYLEAHKEIVKKRILSNALPSFLDPTDPEGSFEKVYEMRLVLYENLSAIKITTTGQKESEILKKLTAIAHG